MISECLNLLGIKFCLLLGFLDLSFHFRPFDNHYEVHRRYILTSSGESFIVNVMSVDPHSNVVDALVGLVHRSMFRKITQKRGTETTNN